MALPDRLRLHPCPLFCDLPMKKPRSPDWQTRGLGNCTREKAACVAGFLAYEMRSKCPNSSTESGEKFIVVVIGPVGNYGHPVG